MSELRFGIIGTGFWARYQLAAWQELTGARCVALCNRTRDKAEALAHDFEVPTVYDDAEEMLRGEALDFVDVITDVGTHRRFVEMCARHGMPVISQKPMAAELETAEALVETCAKANVPFFVHENWRWQRPIRELKAVLERGTIGRPFRGRIQYSCSFPVFDNQPFLRELDRFIITDIGSHILDVARFLFGEARLLFCQTDRIHEDIRGEDVATVMMEMDPKCSVVCEMSYASLTEHERFPETYVFVEGDAGSVVLGPDYWIRTTTKEGTWAKRFPPKRYRWMDPDYALVHASIVDCNNDLLRGLQSGNPAETEGRDNIKTMRLVFGAYQSANEGRAIVPGGESNG